MLKINSISIDKPMFPTKIVWTWTTVFIGMFIYVLVWFSMGTVILTTIQAFTDGFDFASPWSQTVELITNIIYWHPIISLFGWIFYGFVNSFRHDEAAWRA